MPIVASAARKSRFPRPPLEGVQAVLHSFSEDLTVSEAGSRLRLTSLRYGTVLLALDGRGLWPTFNYGRFGMGGTTAQGVVQLYRWWRGLSRYPMGWWGQCVRHGLGSQQTLDLLRAGGYDHPPAVACVLCGSADVGDWWSRDDAEGPCCRGGRCRTAENKGV